MGTGKIQNGGAAIARSHGEWCALLAGRTLPAAVVDLDAFDRNLARIAQVASATGTRVRIATKSVRVPALIERVLANGAPFAGLMCFAAGEAELLARRGCDDLLVAYPTVQPADLAILRELAELGTRVALVVDSVDAAARVSAAMRGASQPMRLVLDVDMSLRLAGDRIHIGVRRSPLADAVGVEAVARKVAAIDDVVVVGAMGYDAQVAGLPDRNPFRRLRNPAARWVRSRSMRTIVTRRAAVRAALERAGVEVEVFNGGGTGSLTHAAADPALTEVTAGSGLYCPHLFDYYAGTPFEPAAFFALQAVREPAEGIVTCLGGGYVASGEAGRDRLPRPVSPAGAGLVAAEGCGEVQTPVTLPGGVHVAPGDPVVFRHAKAGELFERFATCLLVRGGEIVDEVATYRGMGVTLF